mgnify:CR=1 FL=1
MKKNRYFIFDKNLDYLLIFIISLFYLVVFLQDNYFFIAQDDQFHYLLKGKLFGECVLNKDCLPLQGFFNQLLDFQNYGNHIFTDRQFSRVFLFYSPLIDILYFTLYEFFENFDKVFKTVLISNLLLTIFSTVIFLRKFLNFKFFYIYLLSLFFCLILIFNSGFLVTFFSGQSTSLSFLLLSLVYIETKKFKTALILYFLLLSSHAVGVFYALILLIFYVIRFKNYNLRLLSRDFFVIFSSLFFALFVLLYNFSQPYDLDISNVYEHSDDFYLTIQKNLLFFYDFINKVLISSLGKIIFIFALLVIFFSKHKIFYFINSIILSIVIILPTNSFINIIKKSIDLYNLLLVLMATIFLEIFIKENFLKIKKSKDKKLFLISFFTIFIFFISKKVIIDQSLETFQKGPLFSTEIHDDEQIKKVFKKNEFDEILFRGSEMSLYSILTGGMYKEKFTWVDLKNDFESFSGKYLLIEQNSFFENTRKSFKNINQFYNQILVKKNQPYKLNMLSSSTNFDIGISQKFSRKTKVDIFIDNHQKKSFETNKKNLNVNISNLVLEKEFELKIISDNDIIISYIKSQNYGSTYLKKDYSESVNKFSLNFKKSCRKINRVMIFSSLDFWVAEC